MIAPADLEQGRYPFPHISAYATNIFSPQETGLIWLVGLVLHK
jgi:folate-binding Fe-S cluster repair protein YgfZ